MDGSRFDDFARSFVTSRRGALRTLLRGAAAGVASTLIPGSPGVAQECKALRRRCGSDGECCSGMCDPASGRCACGEGAEECGRDCIAVEQFQTDVENCGGCRTTCRRAPECHVPACIDGVCGAAPDPDSIGQSCGRDGGVCGAEGECACPSERQTACRRGCADTTSDPNNCGACDNRCPRVGHGTATCNGGICEFVCDAGYDSCGNGCCAEGRECCNGDCCGPNQCCTADGCAVCRCTIGDKSYPAGSVNPDHDCQYCDPARDRHDWTTSIDGTACGGVPGRVCCNGECCSPTECCDGGQCTVDNCPDQCEIQGQPVEGGDLNIPGGCLICDPESNRFDWTLVGDQTSCGGVAGRVCCNGECCAPTECCGETGCEECGPHCRIDGADVPAETEKPGKPCERCKPDADFDDWTTLDDSTECGVSRVCCNGECCTHGQCCVDGACGECGCEMGGGVERGDVNPLEKCQVCNPDQSRTDWSPGPPNADCGLFNERFCCAGDCCPAGECCNGIGECIPCACVISGNPVLEGAVKPGETCLVCDSSKNRRDWTPLGDGEACGTDSDDRVCCGGTCCAQGECCEDGACTPCGCDIGDDHDIEPDTEKPGEVCQICDPGRERFDWSPVLGEKACGDDGKGVCCGGECCPGDQCCLLDACGECLCAIGEETVAADKANDLNTCEVCKPKIDPFGWTVLDDGDVCGVNGDGECCSGTCCGPDQCCLFGVCTFCGCRIGDQEPDEFEVNLNNECEWCDPVLDQFAWSPRSDEPCGANGDQVCCGGTCCADGECCSLQGVCEPCGCFIGGVHYTHGTRNPSEFCEVCDSDFPDEWSPRLNPDCPPPCLIDGAYVEYGTPNPLNECEACDGGRNFSTWSPASANTRCGPDQSQFCCQGICCQSGACCTPVGACETGGANVCEGCDIGGSFFPDRERNPVTVCQICDIDVSTTSWTNDDFWPCGGTSRQMCCHGVCCAEGAICRNGDTPNAVCS